MELHNNVWKNAACLPPPNSQHAYEKFHENCVNFSLEITLVTDRGQGKPIPHCFLQLACTKRYDK